MGSAGRLAPYPRVLKAETRAKYTCCVEGAWNEPRIHDTTSRGYVSSCVWTVSREIIHLGANEPCSYSQTLNVRF